VVAQFEYSSDGMYDDDERLIARAENFSHGSRSSAGVPVARRKRTSWNLSVRRDARAVRIAGRIAEQAGGKWPTQSSSAPIYFLHAASPAAENGGAKNCPKPWCTALHSGFIMRAFRFSFKMSFLARAPTC
jgi:hypothetical protein